MLHAFYILSGDGVEPNGPLIADSAGNLYGTTVEGGSYGDGIVFELSPPPSGSGGWTETVLYTFAGNGDGEAPHWGLVADSAGNLFGTTLEGGSYTAGDVFELSPPVGGIGPWTESILHTFRAELDGESPYSGVTIGAKGNLFGETSLGGKYDLGTIYEVTPPSAGHTKWSERVLYSFRGGRLGSTPIGILTLGADGSLYGATQQGGDASGVVYQLSPPLAGAEQWSYRVIYDPVGRAGYGSEGSFISDASGSLISSGGGGSKRGGTVFRLSPPQQSQRSWKPELLASFPGRNELTDPLGPLTLAPDGSLYGVSEGINTAAGVFRLVPPQQSGRKWSIDTLYTFAEPPLLTPGPIVDSAGDVFGTTYQDGPNDAGIVYELSP